MRSLRTAQIGRSGELLVQYRLLKWGLETAPMTTDDGIDLVVYSPHIRVAVTVQVKANFCAKPSGGKGRLALDWWLREDSPAALVALVDLSSDRVWLFKHDELMALAQQRSGGRIHFYFYTEANYQPRSPMTHERDYSKFMLDHRVHDIFGLPNEIVAT